MSDRCNMFICFQALDVWAMGITLYCFLYGKVSCLEKKERGFVSRFVVPWKKPYSKLLGYGTWCCVLVQYIRGRCVVQNWPRSKQEQEPAALLMAPRGTKVLSRERQQELRQ